MAVKTYSGLLKADQEKEQRAERVGKENCGNLGADVALVPHPQQVLSPRRRFAPPRTPLRVLVLFCLHGPCTFHFLDDMRHVLPLQRTPLFWSADGFVEVLHCHCKLSRKTGGRNVTNPSA